MKLIIDIDDNVFTRLFDNGVDTSSEDRKVIDRAVRNGKAYFAIAKLIRRDARADIIHSIAKQFSEHNEVVPPWLSIGDIKPDKEAENDCD